MFEKAILDFARKSPYYSKYQRIYDLWQKNPDKYKCTFSTVEMMLEMIVRNALEAAIENDNVVCRKDEMLDSELRDLEKMINN